MLGSVSIGGTETYVNFGLATYLPPRYLLMLEDPGRQTVSSRVRPGHIETVRLEEYHNAQYDYDGLI